MDGLLRSIDDIPRIPSSRSSLTLGSPQPIRRSVDFPLDLLRAIDREAQRIGVNRQAFIRLRLADALTTKAS